MNRRHRPLPDHHRRTRHRRLTHRGRPGPTSPSSPRFRAPHPLVSKVKKRVRHDELETGSATDDTTFSPARAARQPDQAGGSRERAASSTGHTVEVIERSYGLIPTTRAAPGGGCSRHGFKFATPIADRINVGGIPEEGPPPPSSPADFSCACIAHALLPDPVSRPVTPPWRELHVIFNFA